MRGKRSKQYRKLMHQYQLTFNFREPYQVLVDDGMVRDSCRFKMDLVGGLKRTLHGEVKPMITTCCMRHLYADKDNQEAIELAKSYERRRCNHHTLENPLSTLECMSEVVDPRDSLTNKHRYVVASQDPRVRAHMRSIPGIPLVYIARSVMIMEPMAEATDDARLRDERSKFRQGLKMRINPRTALGKQARKKQADIDERHKITGQDVGNKLKKKRQEDMISQSATSGGLREADAANIPEDQEEESSHKRKRKRKSSKRAPDEMAAMVMTEE